MDDLTLKEELEVMKAAALAGSDAPEKLDKTRARTFVHETLEKETAARRKGFFSAPFAFATSFALVACLAAGVFIFGPTRHTEMEVMQQDSFHAAIDTLDAAADTLRPAEESLEIFSIDE